MSEIQKWVDVTQFLGLKKGEMIDFDYEDRKIMILNLNGEFVASDRICTHAYVDLTSGFLDESEKRIKPDRQLSDWFKQKEN